MPDALARPPWRGRTNVDALTIAAIEYAERLAGRTFVVTQGSYQSTVAASAGTHDRGGVVDLRWTGDSDDVRVLRLAGFAAWHRRPSQGPWPDHIHAVLVGHPNLAPSAARQVTAYRANRNGLKDNGPDDGPRVTAHPRANWWPPHEEDDMFSDNDRELLKETRDAARAAATAAERARKGSFARDQRLIQKVTGVAVDVRDIEKAVDEFDAEDDQ